MCYTLNKSHLNSFISVSTCGEFAICGKFYISHSINFCLTFMFLLSRTSIVCFDSKFEIGQQTSCNIEKAVKYKTIRKYNLTSSPPREQHSTIPKENPG